MTGVKRETGTGRKVLRFESLRKSGCTVFVPVTVTRGKPAVSARERRWDHFSHEAAAARTPTLTFSESAREKGGVREAEKVE